MRHRSKTLRILFAAVSIALLITTAVPAWAVDIGAVAGINSSEIGDVCATDVLTQRAGSGQVKVDAYLYAEPSTSSKKLVMLSKNIIVTYVGETEGFIYVTYKTREGYIEKSKVQDITAAEVQKQATGSVERAVTPNQSQANASIASALATAKQKNSDVTGYISINGTNIQQPIMFKSGDVHYYSYRDINGKKDSAGLVYTFYNTAYRNNTITGHNMRGSNRLFHQLHHLQEKALGYSSCQHSKCTSPSLAGVPDIRTAANRVWDISLFGFNKWEVWAMYEVKKDEPKSTLNSNIHPLAGYSDGQVQSWIQGQKDRSEIKFDTAVSAKDTLLTIYTCGTEYDSSKAQSRLYFFLKAVA